MTMIELCKKLEQLGASSLIVRYDSGMSQVEFDAVETAPEIELPQSTQSIVGQYVQHTLDKLLSAWTDEQGSHGLMQLDLHNGKVYISHQERLVDIKTHNFTLNLADDKVE